MRKTMFEARKLHRVFALVLALLCCLAFAGCNSQKDVNPDDKQTVNQDAEPNAPVTDPVDEPGEPDDESGEAETQQRVTDVSSTDPEVHVDLLKLDFDEGEIPESWYYRSTVDETGLACYEIMPVDAEAPILIPMASTVIYMTDRTQPESGEASGEVSEDASVQEDQAYYERVTLTYLLDGEPIESVQYQLFVPNVYDLSASNIAE